MWINLIILNVTILFSSQNIFRKLESLLRKISFFLLFYYFFPYAKKNCTINYQRYSSYGCLLCKWYGIKSCEHGSSWLDDDDDVVEFILSVRLYGVWTTTRTTIPVRLFKLHGFYYCFSNTYIQFLCLKLYSSLHTNGFMRLHHTLSNECKIRLTLIYAQAIQVHCNLHYELLRKIYNIFYECIVVEASKSKTEKKKASIRCSKLLNL